jgi:hypothetical protein
LRDADVGTRRDAFAAFYAAHPELKIAGSADVGNAEFYARKAYDAQWAGKGGGSGDPGKAWHDLFGAGPDAATQAANSAAATWLLQSANGEGTNATRPVGYNGPDIGPGMIWTPYGPVPGASLGRPGSTTPFGNLPGFVTQPDATWLAYWDIIKAPGSHTVAPYIPGGPPAFMAEGGIVESATRAIIGERGPEAVIPLSQLHNYGGDSEGLIAAVTGVRQSIEGQGAGVLTKIGTLLVSHHAELQDTVARLTRQHAEALTRLVAVERELRKANARGRAWGAQ